MRNLSEMYLKVIKKKSFYLQTQQNQDNLDVHLVVAELSLIPASHLNIWEVCHSKDFDYLIPYFIFTDFDLESLYLRLQGIYLILFCVEIQIMVNKDTSNNC